MSRRGRKTLVRVARWVRSKLTSGALILGYHRVAGSVVDPYGITVTPEHFAEQMAVLRANACPMSLTDLLNCLQNRSLPQRAVVITFDDGYLDNLHYAKPLLEEYEVPATFFITTGFMGRQYWWDELAGLLLRSVEMPHTILLSIKGKMFHWTTADLERPISKRNGSVKRQRLLMELYNQLLPLSQLERESALDQLRDQLGTSPQLACHTRVMRPDEVMSLVDGELVDIGAHTVTHPVLADLPAATQRDEISESKKHLETFLQRPVKYFSYPHGSFTDETQKLVREAGLLCGCASHNDVVTSNSSLFYLPRFWVPDQDGDTFARWLRHWLPGSSRQPR